MSWNVCSYLYWIDRGNGTIERANITSGSADGREIIQRSSNRCINVLAIDYDQHAIYWSDRCASQIGTCWMDGEGFTVMFKGGIYFCSGLDVFNGTMYWSQLQYPNYLVIYATTGEGPPRMVMFGRNIAQINALKVVHPLKQWLPDSECTLYIYNIFIV